MHVVRQNERTCDSVTADEVELEVRDGLMFVGAADLVVDVDEEGLAAICVLAKLLQKQLHRQPAKRLTDMQTELSEIVDSVRDLGRKCENTVRRKVMAYWLAHGDRIVHVRVDPGGWKLCAVILQAWRVQDVNMMACRRACCCEC